MPSGLQMTCLDSRRKAKQGASRTLKASTGMTSTHAGTRIRDLVDCVGSNACLGMLRCCGVQGAAPVPTGPRGCCVMGLTSHFQVSNHMTQGQAKQTWQTAVHRLSCFSGFLKCLVLKSWGQGRKHGLAAQVD